METRESLMKLVTKMVSNNSIGLHKRVHHCQFQRQTLNENQTDFT